MNKKLSIIELEDILDWLNECASSFNHGYADYIFKQYKNNKSDSQPSIIALTAVLFGHPNGAEDKMEKNEDKYSTKLFEFCKNNVDQMCIDFNADEANLSLGKYKKVMRQLLVEFARDCCVSVKKKDFNVINDKYPIYQEVFQDLNL